MNQFTVQEANVLHCIPSFRHSLIGGFFFVVVVSLRVFLQWEEGCWALPSMVLVQHEFSLNVSLSDALKADVSIGGFSNLIAAQI